MKEISAIKLLTSWKYHVSVIGSCLISIALYFALGYPPWMMMVLAGVIGLFAAFAFGRVEEGEHYAF